MPRAFLITNKRYNSAVDYDDSNLSRETSPERTVCTAEEPLHIDEESNDKPVEFTSLKPTSPKSPAHESNGPSSPSEKNKESHKPTTSSDSTSTGSNTVRRTLTFNDGVQRTCILPCHASAALVNVIRQLMVQTNLPVATSTMILQSPKIHSVSDYTIRDTSDNHVCPECGKRYSTSSNLARHRQTHRSVTDKKARKCPHCDKVYVSMPAYSMHVRTHSQGCQCPYCGKCFSRPWLLQGHIRTHTGEKPFSCPICHKAFADKSNLRAHIQTHSSSKPYVCQRCNKAFALKSYLYKHEESSCMRLYRHQDKDKADTPPVSDTEQNTQVKVDTR